MGFQLESNFKSMDWYYAKHGKQQGPLPVDRLKAMIESGEVAPTDLVWREGMAEWLPVVQVTELRNPVPSSAISPGGGAQNPQTGYEPPLAPPGPQQHIPSYLVPSILATVLCCNPLGIPAIVFAAQVDGLVARGDIAGAMNASRKARMWTWICFGSGLAFVLIYSVGMTALGV